MLPLDWSLPFELMCNANYHAIGVFLGQRKDKKPYILFTVGLTLDNAQMNYSMTKKELLAIVFPLGKFILYLVGSPI